MENREEVIDALECLEEVLCVLEVAGEEVCKVVLEHMRHLDTSVVLGVLRARSDFSSRPGTDHWAKILRYVLYILYYCTMYTNIY